MLPRHVLGKNDLHSNGECGKHRHHTEMMYYHFYEVLLDGQKVWCLTTDFD